MVGLVVMWGGNRRAAFALAAIFSEVGNYAIHVIELGAVKEISPIPNGLHQARVAEFFQVK
jgi:hypothetical protein